MGGSQSQQQQQEQTSTSGVLSNVEQPFSSNQNVSFEASLSRIPKLHAQIEADLVKDYHIVGLGNYEQTVGHYHWGIVDWYHQQVQQNKIIGNPYDELSLIYASLDLQLHIKVLEQGLQWYKKMMNPERHSYQMHIGKAHLEYKIRHYAQAIQDYKLIAEKKPQWMPPLECLSLAYEFKMEKKEQAVDYADKILTIDPENLWGLYIRARHAPDPLKTVQTSKQILRLYPKYADIYVQIGNAYSQLNQTKQAISWYQRGVDAVPDFALCYSNLGVAHFNKGDQKKALHWFMMAIERDDQLIEPTRHIIEYCLSRQVTPQQTQQMVKEYQRMNPYLLYFTMGEALFSREQFSESIEWFELALKHKHIKNFSAYNLSGAARYSLKEYKKAQEAYLKCIDLHPSHKTASFNLAMTYKAMNDYQKAVKWFETSLSLNKGDRDALQNIVNIYRTQGNKQKLIFWLNQMIDSFPDDSQGYSDLGDFYRQQEKFQEAAIQYEQAINIDEKDSVCYANLGYCFLKLGKYEQSNVAMAKVNQLKDEQGQLNVRKRRAFLTTLRLIKSEVETKSSTYSHKIELTELISAYESDITTTLSDKSPYNLAQRGSKTEFIELLNEVASQQFSMNKLKKFYPHFSKLYHSNPQYFCIIPLILIQEYKKCVRDERNYDDFESMAKDMLSGLIDIERLEIGNNRPRVQAKLDIATTAEIKDSGKELEHNLKIDDYWDFERALTMTCNRSRSIIPDLQQLLKEISSTTSAVSYQLIEGIPSNKVTKFVKICQLFFQVYGQNSKQGIFKQVRRSIHDQITLQKQQPFTLLRVINASVYIWNEHSSQIIRSHKDSSLDSVADSVRIKGKLSYHNIENMLQAAEIAQYVLNKRGHQIVQVKNRSEQVQHLDVSLIVSFQSKEIEIQFKLIEFQRSLDFIDLLRSLRDFPIGIVTASVLLLARKVNHPLPALLLGLTSKFEKAKYDKERRIRKSAQLLLNSIYESLAHQLF